MSKIPYIVYSGTFPMPYNMADTVQIAFDVRDGDADLGLRPQTDDIYVRDARFPDKGFRAYSLPPDIDPEIENPKKGITGVITFMIYPGDELITPRVDTDYHKYSDTFSYHIFIVDRAGNHSDTITTPPYIYMK